jgi:hypothetical protein
MVGQALDASSAFTNELRTDDVGLLPIAAFDKHVGLDRVDELERRILVEQRNVIDHLERRQHFCSLHLTEDRATRSFAEPLDRPIAVQADDETIAEAPRLAQRADVSGVKQIEASVGEHDRPSGTSLIGEGFAQLGTVQEAPHVRSVASRPSGGEPFRSRCGC